MSQRSKNLLEAFNQSKAPEKSAQPVAAPRGSSPRVGGPFADSGAPARQKSEGRSREAGAGANLAARTMSAVALGPARGRILLLCAAVAVVFFFIGRASMPSVAAADGLEGTSQAGLAPGAQTPAAQVPQNPEPAPGVPASSSASTAPDHALLNKANNYTVLAATYVWTDSKSRDARELIAKEACLALQKKGLPAALYRHPSKKQFAILIGAAPRIVDLDALLLTVQKTPSERGKLEFGTALTVPINNYVER